MSEKFIVKTDKGKAKREIVSNFFWLCSHTYFVPYYLMMRLS